MSDTPEKPPSLQRQMVKGSAWVVGVRWAVRALGLVSTIFLARLLTPADFGIVAIAMMILGTVEIFTQTGQHLAIIRHPNPTREHYDSAWTIFILLYSTLALIIFLSAPLTVIYFHEPRAMWVVRILALRTFIAGFENVGIVDFQKHLQFHKEFLYRTLPSVVSFFVTLAAAFALRNYWALVIGILTQEFAGFVLSYVLSPFRPRLDLSKVRELWSFSIWMFVRGIGGYLGNQTDKLVIGGALPAPPPWWYLQTLCIAGDEDGVNSCAVVDAVTIVNPHDHLKRGGYREIEQVEPVSARRERWHRRQRELGLKEEWTPRNRGTVAFHPKDLQSVRYQPGWFKRSSWSLLQILFKDLNYFIRFYGARKRINLYIGRSLL